MLFHEAVGHRLEGERQDDDKDGQTFRGQVGQQVLPPFLTIVDDPTLRRRERRAAQRHLRLRRAGRAGAAHVLVEDGRARDLPALAQAR